MLVPAGKGFDGNQVYIFFVGLCGNGVRDFGFTNFGGRDCAIIFHMMMTGSVMLLCKDFQCC